MKNFIAVLNFKNCNKCNKNVFGFVNKKSMFMNFKNMFNKCTKILNCIKTLNTKIYLPMAIKLVSLF